MKTYDVHFNDETASNNEGFKQSYGFCMDFIKMWNFTHHSYFGDYVGGVVSIVCNETGETVYEEEVV